MKSNFLLLPVLGLVCCVGLVNFAARAADAHPAVPARVELNAAQAGPREVEEQTERAVVRDYGAAWGALNETLERNQPERLQRLWAGFARQRVLAAIEQQQRSGVRVRYVDYGHRLSAVFYSPEGSALQLHDTAQMERQVLDGDTVVDAERVTLHYLVVMTPSSDRWQVRLLQSVPGF
jgi:hypothetical protein